MNLYCIIILWPCITAKLLVASGFPIPTGENIEILDLIDPNFKCIYKDERAKRGGTALGGMLKIKL